MGDNFGLNDNYTYREFTLDSLDNSGSYSGGSAATDWPLFQVSGIGPIANIAAIKVLEAEIPFSWYVFNSVNNTFVLTEDGHSDVTVTIPEGNYTADQMNTVLAAALTAVSPSTFTYSITYNANTQKYTLYNNSAVTHPFTFTFGAGAGIPGVQPNSGNKNPRLWLGFPPGSTTSQGFLASGTNKGNYMVTPNAQMVSGPNYLYLNSAKIGSDVDLWLPSGAFNLGGGKAGVQICKIPVTDNATGIVFWKDPCPMMWFKYDQLQTLTTMDLYLTMGNTTSQVPLQLNGLGFSVKLGILQRNEDNEDHGFGNAANGRVATRVGSKRIRPPF